MHRSRELANGRVIVDGHDRGGGFALERRAVVTAAHVVRGCDASAIRFQPSSGTASVGVVAVETADPIDVSVLRLNGEVPVLLGAGRAVEEVPFQVDARPGPNDPRLTGIIRAVRWPVELQGGRVAEVLQLGLDHPVGDYSGYSGCAVSSPSGVAVGVLLEQLPDRSRGRSSRAAPVLYAMPIETVLEALALELPLKEVLHATDPGSGAGLARASLRPPGAESHFVARGDELQSITDAWRTQESVLLHGLPGAGKSALATEAAVIAAGEFPDGVFYLDMRGLDDSAVGVEAALDRILDALGISSDAHPSELAQKEALATALLANQRILVILDDVRDEAQVRPFNGRSFSILVTSRSLLPALPDIARIEVRAFGPDDGVRLLERLAGPDRINAERDQALRLVELCGGLPLALRITGGRLATRSTLSVRDYADRLDDERRRLDQLRLGDLDVRASFELSYRLLTEGEQQVLRHVGLMRSPTVADDAVSAAVGEEALDALEALVDVGLLTGQQERYEVHELIRLFASEQLTEVERREGVGQLGEFFASEVEEQTVALRTGTGRGALEWVSTELTTLEYLPRALIEEGFAETAVKLALAVGPFYAVLYAWAAWERAIQAGLDAAEEARDEGAAMRLRHNLAVVLSKLGRRDESLVLLKQVLDEARSAGNTALEARALAHLGQRAKEDGRPGEAAGLLEQSADAYERADEIHGLAEALGDWANALDDLGRHDEALARHRDAAARFEALGDRYGQALELGNAGIALQRLDRLEEAAIAHRESQALFESIGAEVAMCVATRRLNETRWQLGNDGEVEEEFARAIAGLDAAGAKHELAEALAARETCLVQSGRTEEALHDARRAADLYADSGDLRGEAKQRIRIGELVGGDLGIGEFVRAEELYIAAGDRPSGPRAHGLSERALDAMQRHDTATAIDLWQRAVDVFAEVGLSWRAALVLHIAAPMLEEAGELVGAAEFRDRTATELDSAEASPPAQFWPQVSVRRASDRIQAAILHLWVVQAAEAAESTGPYRVEVVSGATSPPGMTMRINAGQMTMHRDLLQTSGVREHLRLGWHIYSMVGGHELMRRGVRSDDELGPFLLDVAGEWLAAGRFQDPPGTPMFRSRPAPRAADDVLPLGAAVGGALGGSEVHLADSEEWITNHRGSPYAPLAHELLKSLAEITSATEMFEALTGYWKLWTARP